MMWTNWLRFLVLSILLVAVQVWVLSPVSLWQVATPYIYPVLLLLLPIKQRPMSLAIIGFAIGCVLDLLSLTPGLHASVFTLVSFLRYWLLIPLVDRDVLPQALPLPTTLGGKSVLLLVELFVLHHLLLYFLDAGAFFDVPYLFLRLGCGLVVSLTLALLVVLFVGIRIHPRSSYGQ